MTERQQEMAAEALARAEGGVSIANYTPIFEGFAAMGIMPDRIEPRVNVLTYHAWRAKGRQVRRGEHGVKVCTWVVIEETDADGNKSTSRRPKTAVVFHVSQTDPIN